MSDHHLAIYTMLNSTYTRLEPNFLWRRQNKHCFKESFLQDLKNGISNDNIFSHFNGKFKETLDHHVPIKITKLRGNTKSHINKILRKEIMKRSRLKNKANKTVSVEDLRLHKIQRNVVTKLNKKLKRAYFKKNFREEKT